MAVDIQEGCRPQVAGEARGAEEEIFRERRSRLGNGNGSSVGCNGSGHCKVKKWVSILMLKERLISRGEERIMIPDFQTFS